MARTVLIALLVACSSPPAPPATAPPPTTRVESPPTRRPIARDATPAPAPPAFAPSAADCAALRAAPALGIAVVTIAKPDCSSVGHTRIVLEVRSLARGTATTVVTSRPLHDRTQVGDMVIAAIDPAQRPAEKVYCVELPAHDGTLRRAIPVEAAEADRILAELASGSLCPP